MTLSQQSYKYHTKKTHLKTGLFSRRCIIKISILSHYLFILLFIISFCVHFSYYSVLFPGDCHILDPLLLYSISLINTYYVLCMCCLIVVVQFKYNVKRLELFKIRRYIKCPLLLLLLLYRSTVALSLHSFSEMKM